MALQDHLDRVERAAINEALEQTRYNRTAAAKLLGITFRALRYRMERLGIKDELDRRANSRKAPRPARPHPDAEFESALAMPLKLDTDGSRRGNPVSAVAELRRAARGRRARTPRHSQHQPAARRVRRAER